MSDSWWTIIAINSLVGVYCAQNTYAACWQKFLAARPYFTNSVTELRSDNISLSLRLLKRYDPISIFDTGVVTSQIYFRFRVQLRIRPRRPKSICKTNFDNIYQSTGEILLLPVSETDRTHPVSIVSYILLVVRVWYCNESKVLVWYIDIMMYTVSNVHRIHPWHTCFLIWQT